MYDTFISYRRDGGKEIAPRLYDYINSCGFDAFLDLAEMGSGRFDEQLRLRLENADNFVLILSPGALDRCTDEEDWVRTEIRTAIKLNKNIVLFQSEEFDYPEQLPEDIKSIRLYQAIFYHDTTVHLQIKRVVEMLKKEADGEERGIDKRGARKSFSFRGEYITEYEDIENTRTVIKKAPATLHQLGNKIWGTTAFSEDKHWKIQAKLYNKKQIAGIYYATGYLDDGFGTFFLEAKTQWKLEGFWSGYDSVAKKVTSGRYVFYKKHHSHKIINAQPEHYTAIIRIASERLGQNYVTRQGLAKMVSNGAVLLAAEDKKTNEILGFCLVTMTDYDEVLKITGGKQIAELDGDDKIGYVKTIAVSKNHSGKSIGSDLLKAAMARLKSLGADSYISTAWKHAGIVNVASLLKNQGFSKKMELEEYWLESSIKEGFECPHCGNPCHCSCVIYTK